jgi:hypothetical protein
MVPGTWADWAEACWISGEFGDGPHVALGCGPIAQAGFGLRRGGE